MALELLDNTISHYMALELLVTMEEQCNWMVYPV